MALNKKDIFGRDDVVYKTIKIKAWDNEELILKSLSAREQADWMKKSQKKNADQLDTMVDVVIMSCVDDNHNKLFDKQDGPALANKQFAAITQIFDAALNLAGLGEDEVEEEAKN